MPNCFTAEEKATARAGGTVLFEFQMWNPMEDEWRGQRPTGLTPAQAEELEDLIRGKLKAFKQGG